MVDLRLKRGEYAARWNFCERRNEGRKEEFPAMRAIRISRVRDFPLLLSNKM